VTYTVIWLPDAMTAYRRLRARDHSGAHDIAEAVRALAKEPRPTSSAPLGDSPFRRLRLSSYRVLYEVDEQSEAVYVISVGRTPE